MIGLVALRATAWTLKRIGLGALWVEDRTLAGERRVLHTVRRLIADRRAEIPAAGLFAGVLSLLALVAMTCLLVVAFVWAAAA